MHRGAIFQEVVGGIFGADDERGSRCLGAVVAEGMDHHQRPCCHHRGLGDAHQKALLQGRPLRGGG